MTDSNQINEMVGEPEDDSIHRPLVSAIALCTALVHIYFNTFSTLPEIWMSALHFGLFGLLCALLFPFRRSRNPTLNFLSKVADALIGILALGGGLYLIGFETALYDRGLRFIWSDWFFAVTSVLLAIEFARRTTGWTIPVLIILSLSYVVWWGRMVTGPLSFPGLSLETLIYRSFFGEDGMLGPIARISWSFVYMFILFGAFLLKSGAGTIIIECARAAGGRFRGGPGLVAVLSSGLMGSISGSAVANTVSTGVITIPLMIRSGLSPRFAAGVEAAASTGGQLMPPVMGAGVFIMMNFTQASYVDIIAAAFLPALLYFLSVAFFVRIETIRQDLPQKQDVEGPPLRQVLSRGWPSFLPLGVLIALLIWGFTPTYAAGLSIFAVVAASWLSDRPMGLRDVAAALEAGTRTMTSTAVLLIAVGLIVNVITTTGLGNTFSLMIGMWSNDSLFFTLALVALASLVLGMGLPVTAAYIVLATLSAPVIYGLITDTWLMEAVARGGINDIARAVLILAAPDASAQIGTPMSLDAARLIVERVPADMVLQLKNSLLDPSVLAGALLVAHMIIFWLSQDSNVTPPVCLAAFAAASIARTPPMATGLMAWRIGKGLYLIPLLLAYTPLMSGDWGERLMVFGFAVFGIYASAGAIQGGLEGPLTWPWRALSLAAAVLLLWPDTGWILRLVGLIVLGGAVLWSRRQVAAKES